EVASWPRHALVHRPDAHKSVTDSLLAAGVLHARNEYLFDPYISVRAGMFWLRVLASVWLDDAWGEYAQLARAQLNGGRALTDAQLFALVTVSYNQGYPYVAGLLEAHGADWTRHLNAESADYLERVRFYTMLFQRSALASR